MRVVLSPQQAEILIVIAHSAMDGLHATYNGNLDLERVAPLLRQALRQEALPNPRRARVVCLLGADDLHARKGPAHALSERTNLPAPLSSDHKRRNPPLGNLI